jgi:hypothetical protein
MSNSRSGRRLLTGASVAALTVAIASAANAQLLLGPTAPTSGGTQTIASGTTEPYVIIDGYALTGDFDNAGVIGSSTTHNTQTAILVENNSTITGTLDNQTGGKISAYLSGIVITGSPVAAITNAGVINVGFAATAAAGNTGTDVKFGIAQSGSAVSAVSAITNTGLINVDPGATVVNGAGVAEASLAAGVEQDMVGDTASTVSLTNSGTLTLSALAKATGNGAEGAHAVVTTGVNQFAEIASGAVSVQLTNSGTLQVLATAVVVAHSVSDASAFAHIESGLVQETSGGTVGSISLDNSGTLTLLASASATGGGHVLASATIGEEGLDQRTLDAGTATASLVNTGALTIQASAAASGGLGAGLRRRGYVEPHHRPAPGGHHRRQ